MYCSTDATPGLGCINKYVHVVEAFLEDVVNEVNEILENTHLINLYNALKGVLLKQISKSNDAQHQKLFINIDISDKSQLLQPRKKKVYH